ncbi:hypothetical protein [Candidatus Nanobsidianus stetteri]|uniref:Uncharacterized protein n=1 Tax=Nanobsidianus stetteri TaxID=1294122 RepID=A0A2T9WMD4_NANST|nr:hypothetical protein [Candidatus Nanobsidianus stetteri]MCC5446977.1 hypothetical protein [Candidatus Nanobsidianus stetteri]
MEDKYDPKEIIKNSYKYLNQTIEEAWNVLSKNAPATLRSLDSLIKFMKKKTVSYNNALFNYVEAKSWIDEKHNKNEYYADRILWYILDNYFMAGMVKGISEYAKKLDPKESDYYKKVNHITGFINYLIDLGEFSTIYAAFTEKTTEELKSKGKKSLKDYNNALQKMSDYLANIVENLLEDPIKNRKQFYKSLETRSNYISKLIELLYEASKKIKNIFYHRYN